MTAGGLLHLTVKCKLYHDDVIGTISPDAHRFTRNSPFIKMIYVYMYICISIGLRVVHLKDIKTYFLNKNYDFKNSLCQTCPDIECLFTEGNFNFPEETTICAR